MALQTINIDDRTYEQLLEELKKSIPLNIWTDHNPSDPGIMLLELFAWLGEMTLYRMNRVPETHQNKFLKLIIDSPEPVTVRVNLKLRLSKDHDEFSIPPGIRFATDFKAGKRYVFETFQRTDFFDLKAGVHDISVETRNWKQIKDETIGISDGTPNQTFSVKYAPVLLDFVNACSSYDPNPVLQVGTEKWGLKQFLLTEESKVAGSNEARHFMIDDFDNIIRFGNGEFGAIPQEGAQIICKRYQILEGPDALIKAGSIKYILDRISGLNPGETIILNGNEDAEGGTNFFQEDERFIKGLENYKKKYRLITQDDFEDIIINEFNELQELTAKNDFNELSMPFPKSLLKISRAMALMNFRPNGLRLEKRSGHVTILIIPEFKSNNNLPLVTQEMINIDQSLEEKILRFLDKRRLITTRLHIEAARLKDIELGINVVIKNQENESDMQEVIKESIYDFFDIINGYFDKNGWPLGRNVYKSEIYRLIEDIDGVDHVSVLTLSPASATGDIEIGEYELPALISLDIAIERS